MITKFEYFLKEGLYSVNLSGVEEDRPAFNYIPKVNYLPICEEKTADDFAEKICKEFGYSIILKIGSGDFGYAYKIKDKESKFKVLKITTDRYESRVAEKLRRRPLSKHLINYYDVRILGNGYFSLIMDLVKPLPITDRCIIDEITNKIKYEWVGSVPEFNSDFVRKKLKDENFKKSIEQIMINWFFEIKIYGEMIKIDFYLNQMYELSLELKKNGLKGIDVYSRNMGLNDEGELVHFDISVEPIKDFIFKLKKPVF